jgi:hypothetical protein
MKRDRVKINCKFDRKTARRKFGYKVNYFKLCMANSGIVAKIREYATVGPQPKMANVRSPNRTARR